MKIINYTILGFLVLLASCSQGSQKTNIKVSIAAISGSANFPGGLFLYGKNHKTNKGISKRVPAGDTVELELENGEWGFVLLGWDGSQYYEGNNYCDFTTSPLRLEGEEKDLSFEVSRAKCAARWINGTSENVIDFYALNIHTCSGIQNYISAGKPLPNNFVCDGSMNIFDGGAKYFAVSLAEYNPENGPKFSSKSRCVPVSSSKATSNIKLPFSSDSLNAALVVQSFKDSSCNDLDKSYVFKNGFKALADDAKAVATLDSTNDKINLYTHVELCNEQQKAEPVYAASFGTTHLICNAAQFQNIASNPSDDFVLGADIDMSGAPSVSSFSGNLDGGGKTLFNGDIPLFETITSTSDKVEVQDLVFDNYNIVETGTPASQDALGILARTITTSTNSVEIQNIIIRENSKVELSVADGATIASTTALGGLVGKLDTGTASIDIRNVSSHADVIALDNDVRVGGLIGISDGSSADIKFESNFIGNKISRPLVSGKRNVGGFIGQLKASEISEGNSIVVKIQGETNIGGIVGDAQAGSEIRNSIVDVIFENKAGIDAVNVGGVIGAVAGDFNVQVSGVNSYFKIFTPSGSEEVDKLGGILGGLNIGGAQSNSFRISDSKAFVDFTIDGSYHGGLIGNFDIAGSVNSAEIINSISMGSMKQENPLSSNDYKGGFAGKAVKLSVKRSVSDMHLIVGDGYLGGGFGAGYSDSIEESHINGKIDCHASSNISCGGIVGYSGVAIAVKYNKIKTNVDIKTVNTTTPTYVGLMAGNISIDNIMTFQNIIAMGSVENSSASLSYPMCDGFCISGQEYDGASTLTSDASCSGLPAEFDAVSTFCQLTFHRRWEEFGFKNIGTPNYLGGEFLAGNLHEPFEINDASEWNEIGDDVFLMEKTFELQSDLNFQDISSTDNIVPIGTISNSFKGRIIPNGKSLLGVDHTATTMVPGIFPKIENATIGWYGDPLIIEGLRLDCAGYSRCGTIGFADGGSIFMVVEDAYIFGSGAEHGGFVGAGNNSITIKESYFQGEVIGSSNEIGGLVGSFDGKLNIEETAIYLDKLSGADNLGGVLGQFKTSGNIDELNIKNSYIVFDEKSDHPGVNFYGSSGTQMGVLFGYAANASLDVQNFYMDLRNLAVVGGTLSTTWDGAGAISPATLDEFYKIGSPAGIVDNGGIVISKPSDALNDFENNDGKDKWVSIGDELYLSWETTIFNLTNP